MELREYHPDLFHPTQDWFIGQTFMQTEIDTEEYTTLPKQVFLMPIVMKGQKLPTAGQLIYLYLQSPEAQVWRDYLWTSDFDHQKQRVYIGGTANGRQMEIHRHLALSERWGVPLWQ